MPITFKCDEEGNATAVRARIEDGVVKCCAPDCCMYPADWLKDTRWSRDTWTGGFVAADLPATLYGKWAGRADGTFTKSGSEYTLGTVTIRVNAAGTAWEFYDSDDDATRPIGQCLIRGDGNFTPGDDAVEDQFADSYTLSLYEIYRWYHVVAERISLCDYKSIRVDGVDIDDEEHSRLINNPNAGDVGKILEYAYIYKWFLFRKAYMHIIEFREDHGGVWASPIFASSGEFQTPPWSSPAGVYVDDWSPYTIIVT